MSRKKDHICLVIKCLVYICYIQTLVSAITVDPDATTENLSKDVLKEIEKDEADLQKDLHPLTVKREANYWARWNPGVSTEKITKDLMLEIKKDEAGLQKVFHPSIVKREASSDDEKEKEEPDKKYINTVPPPLPAKQASTYHNNPHTIQATKSDGIVVIATTTIGGDERKYTYDNNGGVTENILEIENIRSSYLFDYYWEITGTEYVITALNSQGQTEVDTLSVTSTTSTYTHYQDGTYTSPTTSSTPLPVYTKTAIFEEFGTLTTTYYTIHSNVNFTDALAYNTYSTTDNSGNVVTNTITTFEVTITENNVPTTTLLTYTGLGTVVTSTDFYGEPTLVTSVNEVTVSTDETGGIVTKTIQSATNPLATSVQTITTTDNNGNTITETTTVTGQGAISLLETVTITESTSTGRDGIETTSTNIRSISPTSTGYTEYRTTGTDGSTSTETDSNGSVITVDSNGDTITTFTTVQEGTTLTATLTLKDTTVITTTKDITVTETYPIYASGSFYYDVDLDGSFTLLPAYEITATDLVESTTTEITSTGSNGESIVYTVSISASFVIDSSGNTVYDDNGEPVTELITETISPSYASVIIVTDSSGNIVTDENGNTVTEVVTESTTSESGSGSESGSNSGSDSGSDSSGDTVTDANGNPVTETVINVTDPSGNIVTDVNGNPVTERVITVTDSSGNAITDGNGNIVTEIVTESILSSTESTTSESGSSSESGSDSGSSGETVTDANGNPVTETVINVTDPSGNIVTDLNGNPVTERVITVTDASGNAITDGNGNIVTEIVTESILSSTESTTSESGSSSESGSDSGSSGETVTDANGNPVTETVINVTDPSGNIVTDVNGNPVTERVITVTDASGNAVTDGNGNIVTEIVTEYILSSTESTTSKSGSSSESGSDSGSSGVTVTDANGNPVTETVINVTDPSGNIVTDVNGNPVTERVITVTDSSGNAITDGNGNIVTEIVTDSLLSSTDSTSSESGSSSDSGSDPGSGSYSGSGSGSGSGSLQASLEFNSTVSDCNKTSFIYNLEENMILGLASYGRKKCPIKKEKPFVQQMPTEIESTGFALLWHMEKNAMLLTDRYGKQVLKQCPESGKWVHLYLASRHVEAIIPTIDPQVYIIVVDRIIANIKTAFKKDGVIVKYKKLFASFDSSIGFSMARTDPSGRLWLSVRYAENGVEKENLYMICSGKATVQETIIQITGGMAWTPNKQYFYISDLKSRVIYVYDYNDIAGTIQNRQVLIDFKNHKDFIGTPYDIAVDSEGHLWVAMFGNSEVIKINGATREVEEIIAIPHSYPVSLAFGEPKHNRLIVTTAFNDTHSLPFVYAISNTGVKGYNPTHIISPDLVFGSSTMEITIEGADPQPRDTTYPVLPYVECNIPSTVMPYTKVSKNACAFKPDAPIIQVTKAEISTLGIAAHYDQKTGAVYMTDVAKPAALKWTESDEKTVTLTFEDVSLTTTVIPIKGESEKFIVAEDKQIVVLENKFKRSETLGKSHKSIIAKLKDSDANLDFNRGKTDSKGRLWIGTRYAVTEQRKACKLYLLTKKSLKEMDKGYTKVGGMAWSKDNSKLYVADAGEGVIYEYKYTESTGEISDRFERFSLNNTAYKNLAIYDIVVDSEDHIWAPVSGGRAVLQISPVGVITREITVPSAFPNVVEFGGEKRDQLLVMTMRAGPAGCSVDNQANLYIISNLGVTAGRLETDRFVL